MLRFGIEVGAIVGLLALTGCFPELDPPETLRRDELLAMRISVVETGPHSEPLGTYPGRIRAELMPGDVFVAQALMFGPDGPGELPEDAIWIQCRSYDSKCRTSLPLAREECGGLLPWTSDPCVFARGRSPRVQVLPIEDPAWQRAAHAVVPLLVVASTSPERSSENCLDALREPAEAHEDMWDCAILSGSARFGPIGRLWQLQEEHGYDSVDTEGLPPEFFELPPDHRPLPGLEVITADEETLALSGEIVRVGPGPVRIGPVFEPIDHEIGWFPGDLSQESFDVVWRTSRGLDADPWIPAAKSMHVEWDPDNGPAYVVFTIQSDHPRSGTWAWLRLEDR